MKVSGCIRMGTSGRIAWSMSPLRHDEGQITFIVATGVDVTVQRDAEDTLRESKARYRQLVEGSLGMVCTHDTKGVILSVNVHGAQDIGRTRDDMVGHPLSEFMPEDRRLSFEKYLNDILRRGEVHGPLHLSHSNSKVRVIAYRNKLIEIFGRELHVRAFGISVSKDSAPKNGKRSRLPYIDVVICRKKWGSLSVRLKVVSNRNVLRRRV